MRWELNTRAATTPDTVIHLTTKSCLLLRSRPSTHYCSVSEYITSLAQIPPYQHALPPVASNIPFRVTWPPPIYATSPPGLAWPGSDIAQQHYTYYSIHTTPDQST